VLRNFFTPAWRLLKQLLAQFEFRPLSYRSTDCNWAYKQQDVCRAIVARCGIIGIFGRGGGVASELYEGLLMLQHRGQDSAGMVTTDGDHYVEHKGNGLVRDVFKEEKVMRALKGRQTVISMYHRVATDTHCPVRLTNRHWCMLKNLGHAGTSGIAHVRYPTAGSTSSKEAQPFFVNSPLGIFLIHNGNLTNTAKLTKSLQSSKSFFNRLLRTTSDSELLLNVFADEIHRAHQRCIEQDPHMNPNSRKMSFVQEAGEAIMQVMLRPYTCPPCLIS
jgi:amidophosphoribosyltransferase